MKTYTITRKAEDFCWENVPTLSIDNLLWSPEVPISAKAQICYDDSAMYVRLQAVEPDIRAENTQVLDEPCQDSCLEFFFSPIPGDNRYFNIEFNLNLCMWLGMGYDFPSNVRLVPEVNPFSPKAERTGDGWFVEYNIPHSFVRQFFPEYAPVSGNSIRANCYKCGDLTVQEHYLAWNPIDLPEPCFHCPQFFGTMFFE